MAISASGFYVANWIDVFDATQLAIDYASNTIKFAMYTNSLTPNFSTDVGYNAAPYTSNEVSGTGYTAGGPTIGSKTLTESPTGTMMFDGADVSLTTSTITNAKGGLLYSDTLTNKNGILFVNFGADYSTTAGTFAITWSASGIGYVDLTP